MGVGGQRPKPKALRSLQGSRKRPWHHVEPAFTVGADAPLSLTVPERAYWDYYAPRLTRTGVLTEGHRETLALLCRGLVEIDQIKATQSESGHKRLLVSITTTRDGQQVTQVRSNPLDGQLRAWMQVVRFYLQELGLTPAARARVGAAGADTAEDPLERFLRRVR